MRVHKIRILSSEKAWLSDEIIQCAQEMLIEVGKTNGLFSVDNPVQPKIVVISPAQVLHHEKKISSSIWWGRRKKTRQKKHIAQNEWRSGRSDRRIHTTRRIQIFIKRALFLPEYFSIPAGCLVSQYNKLSYNSGTLDVDRHAPCQKQNILYLWPSGGQRTKSKRQTSLSKLYWLRS